MSFLKLPSFPQSLIFNYLSLSDTLKLSTCSLKTKEIVKSVAKSCSLTWKVDDDGLHMIEVDQNWNAVRFQLAPGNHGSVSVEINGMKCSVLDNEQFSTWFFENSSHVDRIVEYVTDVLNLDTFNVFMFIDYPMNSFVWKYTRKVKNLRLKRADGPAILSPEDVEFILEDLEVEDLDLECTINEEGFQYIKPLSNRTVRIQNPSWIHFDAILNSNVVWFDLRDYLPSSSNLNKLLKSWMSGGMEKLEFIKINGNGRNLPLGYTEEVFIGIDNTYWDPLAAAKTMIPNDHHEIISGDGRKRAIVKLNPADHYFFVFTALPPE